MTSHPVANKKDQTKDRLIQSFHISDEKVFNQGIHARNVALNAIDNLGVPTTRWEAWKYTTLKDILQPTYHPATTVKKQHIDPVAFSIPELKADQLVFVNGIFQEHLSSIKYNKDKLTIRPLSQMENNDSHKLEEYYGTLIQPDNDIFSAINTAYTHEGVWIQAANNHKATHPIHLLHIIDQEETDISLQHRNLFIAGKSSQLTLLESFHTTGLKETSSLRIVGTEIHVEENAHLEYVKLQLTEGNASQIDMTEAKVEQNAYFKIHTITLGGKLNRNNLHIHLQGENGEAHLMGTYLLDQFQHTDNFTQVDHAVPHCFSNELYKGILNESATGVFNGRIHVHPHAQKTNAFQSNRNILLSDNARIFTKPQLEIYADDVKCSHGATTGRIDKDAMFYLRARGIKEDDAKMLLIFAFATEVTESISLEPVRNYLTELISNRFL